MFIFSIVSFPLLPFSLDFNKFTVYLQPLTKITGAGKHSRGSNNATDSLIKSNGTITDDFILLKWQWIGIRWRVEGPRLRGNELNV